MPEIFRISWSLKVLKHLIFSGVFLRKNTLLIFYILQFERFPEYAWDTLHNFLYKISGICIEYSKFHNLENFLEYAWDILHNFWLILYALSLWCQQEFENNIKYNARLWPIQYPICRT